MSTNQNILLAFYGDDFTGSTDALEFISNAGAKAVLFTEVPSQSQLDAIPGLNAFGVAGKTRSLSPNEMEQMLIPAFKFLKSTGTAHIHYKVCSTFDSSPTIGSIGKAIDCGASVFGSDLIPVLGGMPPLGRYCLFGNLFARMGIGSDGSIFRLDRHPSMSIHPVTPSSESDLRNHLGKQTIKKIGLVDVLQLEKAIDSWEVNPNDSKVILLDALNDAHLEKIGEWLDAETRKGKPLFSVGSSGIEMALGKHWNKQGVLSSISYWPQAGKSSPLLVISGSCSPVTAGQIAYARSAGFEEIILDVKKNCNEDRAENVIVKQVSGLLSDQKSVIVHTGEKESENFPAEKLGSALGRIAKEAISVAGVKRLVVSGGDTSSYAARALEIDAVEMIAPIVRGAPLCKAYSKNKAIDGLEVNFKGGQVGGDNYFELLLNGK